MYRDLSNIRFIALDDADVKFFMNMNPHNKYLIVGHTMDWCNKLNTGVYKHFDDAFYIAANVPIEDKWNKFYFKRDIEKEKDIYHNKFGLKDGEEYLFIHDDPGRGRHLKPSYIPTGFKIIKSDEHKDVKLFDFIYTIENAKEIHLINSSISTLIDTMQIKTGPIFIHKYATSDGKAAPAPNFRLQYTSYEL
jgi:hypothetical protein